MSRSQAPRTKTLPRASSALDARPLEATRGRSAVRRARIQRQHSGTLALWCEEVKLGTMTMNRLLSVLGIATLDPEP